MSCNLSQTNNKCVDIVRNDDNCVKLAECCVGIHDHALQRKCHQRVRECRGLGNAFDPIRALRPLSTKYLYPDGPGFTTQGELVEGFGSFGGLTLDCIMRGMFCALLVSFLIKYMFSTELSIDRILCVAVLASVIQCMLKNL